MHNQSRQNHSKKHHTTGILLVNTGTPTEPTPSAVRRFLAQFLSDPFVINFPRWLWLPLLHEIILRTRPRRSARLYQRIWTEAGSPLLLGTQNLAQKLDTELASKSLKAFHVVAGMRYGEPSIPAGLQQLQKLGCERFIILPLFPQYTGTTSGTILAAVFDELKTWPANPDLTIIRDYHDHPAYLHALAANIREHAPNPKHLLFSFHGIPRSYGDAGDPYESQCRKSAALLAEELNLEPDDWSLAFQSRFGPQEWLTPYTDEELTRYGGEQLTHLKVVCPGFAVDCLETLDEIAHEGREIFQQAGGGSFYYIPALNDSHYHVAALSEIIKENL